MFLMMKRNTFLQHFDLLNRNSNQIREKLNTRITVFNYVFWPICTAIMPCRRYDETIGHFLVNTSRVVIQPGGSIVSFLLFNYDIVASIAYSPII